MLTAQFFRQPTVLQKNEKCYSYNPIKRIKIVHLNKFNKKDWIMKLENARLEKCEFILHTKIIC